MMAQLTCQNLSVGYEGKAVPEEHESGGKRLWSVILRP